MGFCIQWYICMTTSVVSEVLYSLRCPTPDTLIQILVITGLGRTSVQPRVSRTCTDTRGSLQYLPRDVHEDRTKDSAKAHHVPCVHGGL